MSCTLSTLLTHHHIHPAHKTHTKPKQAKFLQFYTKNGLLALDPFETVDATGVGELIRLAVARGRETRPDIELGICGEHGGDPKSIELFEAVGLDYVSCSPLRVPIARLAAAQAFLKAQKAGKKA